MHPGVPSVAISWLKGRRCEQQGVALSQAPCVLNAGIAWWETPVKEVLATILDPGTQPADFAALPLPEAYRAVTLHRDEEHMFDGVPTGDRDPRTSLHVEEVPVPELGLGEALIAVMASAGNYNTVWSSIFSPVSSSAFLRRYGKLSGPTARHDLPYH